MYTQTLQENWKMREAGGDWLEAKVPALGTVSCHLVLSPDDRFLYVANYGDGTLAEYQMAGGLPKWPRSASCRSCSNVLA